VTAAALAAPAPPLPREGREQAARRRLVLLAVVGPPFLYLGLLFMLPLAGMIVYSFGERVGYDVEMTWTLAQYERFLATPEVQGLLWKSLRMATTVTIVSLLLGYPAAYLLARFVPPRWRDTLQMLLIIPSWTSFVIRTYSWLLVLGQEGLVNAGLMALGLTASPLPLAFNEFSVNVALIYINLPWLILPIYVALEKINPSLLEAGEVLGANRVQVFARVVLPLSMPGVVAGVLIVFVPSISTFAVPVILGGTGGYMYGNLINYQFLYLNWPFGAALATVMLAVTLVVVAAGARFVRLEELWSRA
jgi:spermidine/putrescine transport system permease protein